MTETFPNDGEAGTLPPRDDTSSTSSAKDGGRPTTREGRRAQAEARRIRREADAAGKSTDEKPKASKSKSTKGAKATPRRAGLETRLSGAIASLGTAVAVSGLAVGSPAIQNDGAAVIQHGPGLATALDRLAKDDPRVASALERMLTAGAWSGVLAAAAPILVSVAANHNMIPAQLAHMVAGDPSETVPDPNEASAEDLAAAASFLGADQAANGTGPHMTGMAGGGVPGGYGAGLG